MGPIDSTGAATQVVPTTTNRIETPAQADSETERPIEEAEATEGTQNPATSQATESDATLGRFVDTTA